MSYQSEYAAKKRAWQVDCEIRAERGDPPRAWSPQTPIEAYEKRPVDLATMLSDKKMPKVKQKKEAAKDLVKAEKGAEKGAGDNAKYTSFLRQCMVISLHCDQSNADSMRQCFYEYIQLAQQADIKISNQAAYLALGIKPDVAKAWMQRASGTIDQQSLLAEVNQVCAAYREVAANDNKINVAWAIFSAKNYDGMKDEQEVITKQDLPLGEKRSAKEISERYRDLPDE